MGTLTTSRLVRSKQGRDIQTAPAVFADYIDAMVPNVDAVIARWRDVTTAREIAKRIHGPALGCAMINAKVCAATPVRLYTNKGTPNKALAGSKCRDVRDVRRMAYLTDHKRVGAKASMAAQDLDGLVEITDHPVLDILRRPNGQTAGTEYELNRWQDKWLFGNAIQLKLRGARGAITGLALLMPQYVRVQPDEERLISAYWFGRDETKVVAFDAVDVMHQRLAPHWNNPYWGMGPIDIIFRELDLYEFSLAAEQARWQNGGYPSGVLAMKNIKSQDQLDAITRSMERRYSGTNRTGKIMVTSEGTYSQYGKTNEMGYLPGMEHIERRVEQEFGVPEALRKLNEANLASGQMGPDLYYQFTIQPALRLDAEQLTELLLPEFGIAPGTAWFVYDDVSTEDQENVRQDTAVHVAGGVMTINEQRAKLGLEPMDGGDVLRIGGVPISLVGQQPAAPAGPSFSPTINIPQQFRAMEPAETKAIEHEPCGEHIHGKDATDGLVADELSDADKRIIESMRDDVEAWAGRVAAGIRVGPDGAVDLSGFDADLREALLPKLDELLERGARLAADDLSSHGITAVPLTDQAAADFIARRGSLIIEQVRGTAEDQIRQGLLSGVEDGKPLNEVIDALKADLGEQAGARAERIARTETSNAVSHARMEVWSSSGIKRMRWRLAPGACPVCQALVDQSGGVVEIGTPFVKAGTAIGDFTPKFDVYAPPAHPQCRCSAEPLFEDEQ